MKNVQRVRQVSMEHLPRLDLRLISPEGSPEHNERQIALRLEALCGLYRIQPNNWRELALRLAMDFVPGFLKGPSQGKPKKWGFFQDIALVGEVARVMEASSCTKRQACRVLCEEPAWKEFLQRGNRPRKKVRTPDASVPLWQRLKGISEGKKKYVDDILKEFPDGADSGDWQEFVRNALRSPMED